jgi:hypothetical protein
MMITPYRPTTPPAAPITPSCVLVCLSGWGAVSGVPPVDDADDAALFTLWQAREDGVRAQWQQHGDFLRQEAQRLGIRRPGAWLAR